MNFPDGTDSSDSKSLDPGRLESRVLAERVAAMHAECSAELHRLAWAILRDWGFAADAVQETFTLFAQKMNTIEEAHQRGWLVKTVQFQALNLRRSQSRSMQMVDRLCEQPATYTTDASVVAATVKKEEIEQLRQAINELPAEQRQIVQLRLGEEKSFAEIASQLNLPLGTVLSRMRLALDKLRKKLPNDERA